MTALHHATFNNHHTLVSELLKMDVDLDRLRMIRNINGKTAFEMINKQKTKQAFQNLWFSSGMGDTDKMRQQLLTGEDING